MGEHVNITRLREGIANAFGELYAQWDVPSPFKAACETEEGLFTAYPLQPLDNPVSIDQTAYGHAFCQLYANLDPSSYVKNKGLIARVRNDPSICKTLGAMHPRQRFPEEWRHIDERLRKEWKEPDFVGIVTERFKCRKCHNWRCSYFQLQTRSGDEPITTFVTCLECDNRWRE